MTYPLILSSFPADIELLIPDHLQVKPVYEQLLAADSSTPFPFWAKVWASAKALASFLTDHPELVANKSVLEIGAGIGLPSFTIAKQTATLIISDYNADAAALLRKNIQQLGLTNTSAMQLDWNDFPQNLTADVVLLSDVNYAPDQFQNLQQLIHRFLDRGATIILATPQRMMGVPFVEALDKYIKESHVTETKEGKETVLVAVLVLGK